MDILSTLSVNDLATLIERAALTAGLALRRPEWGRRVARHAPALAVSVKLAAPLARLLH